MEKKHRFSFFTASGYSRIMAVCLVMILICSLFACLIESDFGRVKIAKVSFDSRGGVLTGDLYTPIDVSDKDSLPCVILSHGGGCTNGVMKGFAQELARRGIVVLNVNAYGAGLSEQPRYDDSGSGIEEFSIITAQGVYDAVNYVRTLTYVDQSKIGLAGHSMGGKRVALAGQLDCYYYTFNDIMINVLADEFGISFEESEINMDADLVAEERLNDDQLAYYEAIKEEKRTDYDTRIFAIMTMGDSNTYVLDPQVVNVGGYDVERYCAVNFAELCGRFDSNYCMTNPTFEELWQTGGEPIIGWNWYSLRTGESKSVNLGDTDSVDMAALKEELASRYTRIYFSTASSHSREFFDTEATIACTTYFVQAFGIDAGGLSNSDVNWFSREWLNFAAMVAMLVLILSLAGLLSKSRFFAVSLPAVEGSIDGKAAGGRMTYWVGKAVMAIAGFVIMYGTNKMWIVLFDSTPFLPLDKTVSFQYSYIFMMGIFSAIFVAVSVFIGKKRKIETGLKALNITIKFKAVMKQLLLALLVFLVGYMTLAIIVYLFGQDYRLWMCIFTVMKPEHWFQGLRYFVIAIPFFVAISIAVNLNSVEKPKPVLDDIITVIAGSIGVWAVCAINALYIYGGFADTQFSNFFTTYGFIIYIPITVVIARGMYRLTHNVWSGAFLNGFLLMWTWMSSISSTSCYVGETVLRRIIGI